jgi:hypothetical protein
MFPAELGEGKVSGEGVYISPRGVVVQWCIVNVLSFD